MQCLPLNHLVQVVLQEPRPHLIERIVQSLLAHIRKEIASGVSKLKVRRPRPLAQALSPRSNELRLNRVFGRTHLELEATATDALPTGHLLGEHLAVSCRRESGGLALG